MNKNNNKLIVLIMTMIMMTMLSISFVSATDTSTIQKLPQEVTLGQSVDLPQGGSNGTAAWVYCNITRLIDPDHNVLLSDMEMAKGGYNFNFLLNGMYTQTIGSYTVETVCGDGVNVKSGIYSFEVTTTGGSMNSSLWISLVMICISLVLLMIALYADNQYIGFITGISFIVSGMYIMIYGFGSLSDLYTRTIGVVVLALGMIVFFVSAFHSGTEENILGRYFGVPVKERDEYDHFTRDDY